MSHKKKQGVGQNKNFGKSQVRYKPLGTPFLPLAAEPATPKWGRVEESRVHRPIFTGQRQYLFEFITACVTDGFEPTRAREVVDLDQITYLDCFVCV